MKRVCIEPKFVDEIFEASQNVNSQHRKKSFERILGDEALAKNINLLYEKNLLLKQEDKAMKNLLLKQQDKAMKKFIENIDGTGIKKTNKLRKKYIENKQRKIDLADEKQLDELTRDIFETKYGVALSDETITKIGNIKRDVRKKKQIAEKTEALSEEREAYGMAELQLYKEIEKITDPTQSLNFFDTIKSNFKDASDKIVNTEGKYGKILEGAKVPVKLFFSPVAKTLEAAWDVSGIGRQGLKALAKSLDPLSGYTFKDWFKSARQSLGVLKEITNKEGMQLYKDKFMANIIGSENYDIAIKAGLDINVLEEFFPSNIPEKLGLGIGNIYKATDESFSIFQKGIRMELFNKNLILLKKRFPKGVPVEELKSAAQVVNSISGRGNYGKYENLAGVANTVAFSGRWVKSSFDTFTYLLRLDRSLTKTARTQAQINSIETFALIGATMTVASLFTDVGYDIKDRKTFGKVRIPGTDIWTDVSGGLASWLYVAYTAPKNFIKMYKGEKVGIYDNAFSLITNFATNKTSPAFSNLIQIMKGRDYKGKIPTPLSVAINMGTPIVLNEAFEFLMYSMQDEKWVREFLIPSLLEIVGAPSNMVD